MKQDWRHTEYPQQLAGKIFAAANELEALRYQAISLNGILPSGCEVSIPSSISIANECLSEWLSNILRGYSAAACGDSFATISSNELSPEHRTLEEIFEKCRTKIDRRVYSYNNISLALIASEIASNYDFVGLVKELDELSGNLEAKGLSEAADKIGSLFSMRKGYWGASKNCPKIRSRNTLFSLEFCMESYTYPFRLREELRSLINVMEVAEKNTGCEGITDQFSSIYRVLENDSWAIKASRTVINKGANISCTVFNEKLQFTVTQDYAEAIIAFVKNYSSFSMWFTDELKSA